MDPTIATDVENAYLIVSVGSSTTGMRQWKELASASESTQIGKRVQSNATFNNLQFTYDRRLSDKWGFYL